MRALWRLEKMFWVGAVSLIVVVSSIAVARADEAGMKQQTVAQAQHIAQSWSGWVGKIEKSGPNFTLAIGEPTARVYTLEGNAAEFEKLVGTLVKVQGDLSGTTLKVTNVEPSSRAN